VAHYLVLTNQAEAKAAEADSGATAAPAVPAINSAATAADAAPGEPAGNKVPLQFATGTKPRWQLGESWHLQCAQALLLNHL